jgi:pullulanase
MAEEVTFTFEPPEGTEVETVSLRGSFNGWGETAMAKGDDGVWSVALELEAGEHQYKFFINGQWPQNMESGLDGYPIDPTADDFIDDGHGGMNAVRIIGGGKPAEEAVFTDAPALEPGYARIHYHRPTGDYTGWGLHVWDDTTESAEWQSPLVPTGRDGYGLYWDIGLAEQAKKVGFIIHKGDAKDPGPDMFLMIDEHGREVWLVSGRIDLNTEAPDVAALALGDLTRSRAHWLDASTIAWRLRHRDGYSYHLHSARDGGLELGAGGVAGGETFALTREEGPLSPRLRAQFPHLAMGQTALKLADSDLARVPELLKGQVAVSVTDADGGLVDATGLQIPGVLDDLFACECPLGVTWEGTVPTISVWAPTARVVRLHLWAHPHVEESEVVVDMVEEGGVWSVTGQPDWTWHYYKFEVGVYAPTTGKVEWSLVTDPYSRNLSTNSEFSQIVDMDDTSAKPPGWDKLVKPPLEAPEDIVLYELHVRDFSATDPTVPEKLRGTFLAFMPDSNGSRHLRALAEAGLTHVHLLPAFDFATIDENKDNWDIAGDLSSLPPDSDRQQEAIARIADSDPYNWGYDPFHFGVPEGSYSTLPTGPNRILEFRHMIKALSDMGLRTVMDVVYNHTNASGMADRSVLDKIVPGYYHRLNADGFVETSTCCQNTATEHAMMERLMIDDLVHWARDYKVDGFRFDLMGHHMKVNMERARDVLRSLTLEKDGVDGEAIYIYGEGWDFGEVAGGRRGVNATQGNMAGTGIGAFNDRIRDAVRGGSAFSDRREQGFATGLYYDPNGYNTGRYTEREKLLGLQDRIRYGMAGNLREYMLIDHTGREMFGGQYEMVAYASDPEEVINYVSAHDNETFFDKIQYAAPAGATLAERVRMQNLGMAVVALGQGIPFFHAGVDMLRSKSMDADSYNSGDWFNRLDWAYETNNFGVGLPPAEKNRDRWDIIRPILARADITPGRDEILSAVHQFRELLRIRKSAQLLRLRTAEDVHARVRFHNTGPDQIPGVIFMSVSDEVDGLRPIDPNYRRVVVFLNATKEEQTFGHADWKQHSMELHSVQQSSHDEVVQHASFDKGEGTFTVPARTAAVFVEPR